MNARHWTGRAACAAWPELPWTRDTADVHPMTLGAMRAVCENCPVASDCLAAVEDFDITGGFWAGHDRDPHALPPKSAPAWAAPVLWLPVKGHPLIEQAALNIA